MTDTRLTSQRYLEALHLEGERLLAAAQGCLDQPVPACSGWSVEDVVFHLGSVYSHKVAALRHGRRPIEGEWGLPDDAADLDWCHEQLHAVATELARRPADEPAWTWWEPDQSVGFWQRRMALETVVHRVDVEAAAGAVTPVAADLALDGIDEVLSVMLTDAGFEGPGSRRADGDRVVVAIDGVEVDGAPSDVLLWLWGRIGDDAVRIRGEAAEVVEVRAALRAATQ